MLIKNKKLWFWLMFILAIIAAIIYWRKTNLNNTESQQQVQWQKKYPQLLNNVGYAQLSESSTAPKNPSAQGLIGISTNEFGIRDDVLKLILTSIPESDNRSTIAAIKMVQYDEQQIGVTDDKEMNLIANKASAASSCITIPMLERYKFGQKYDQIIRDTPARQAEQDRIEHLLSNHVISSDYGIQSYDPKEQCDHFLGVKS